MPISPVIPNTSTKVYPQKSNFVTSTFDKEKMSWSELKTEQAKVEIDEAIHFMGALGRVIKDYHKAKAEGTAPTMSNICSSAKNILMDKWDYFIQNKYLDDSHEKDCFYNKKVSKEAALLCNDVYKPKAGEIRGWKPIDEIRDKETGLRAVAYQRKKEIFIAYCGTNDYKDFVSDLQLAKGQVPEQLDVGYKFFKDVQEKNPKAHIMITGHSLGGSLAEFIASKEKDTTAITFNSFGVDGIIKDKPQSEFRDNKNVYNYIIEGDPVSNSSKHIGQTTRLPKTALNNHSIANYLDVWI